MDEERVKKTLEEYSKMTLKQFIQEWNQVMDSINPNRKIEPVVECEPTVSMCSICREVLPLEAFQMATPTRRRTRCKECDKMANRVWKRGERELKNGKM